MEFKERMTLENKVNTIDFCYDWKLNNQEKKQDCWLNFKNTVHKIVQIYADDSPFLRIGQFLNTYNPTYHIDILQDFLEECNFKGENLTNNNFEKSKIIPLKGERYTVAGMGMMMCNKEDIIFFGSSHDYEIFTDKTHFNKIKERLQTCISNENFSKD